MSEISSSNGPSPEIASAPDLSGFEVPMDTWTQPFWDAAQKGDLVVPRCADCHTYRWPPGPFCPNCQSQNTEWVPAGPGLIYTFTIVRPRINVTIEKPPVHVPALVEFPEAGNIRIPAAIVDTPISAVKIGAQLELKWSKADNAKIPVFSIS